jgi:uncharacterized coiled-coil DUF342 family protein
LRDIKDDNRDLKILLDRIKLLGQHQQTATNHWPELIELFADLRDQLALHFSLEEAYGYFDEALITAPQLSTTAETLRGQHSDLFERIRRLADRATEVSVDSSEQVSRFLEKFDRFRKDFETHEEDELTLILDSIDDDIGVGD